MIKGITTIRHAAGAKEFKALIKLFDALGFEQGTPWKTARGQGTPFKAPLGQLEFVEGLETLHADIWIEVTDLDSIRDVLAKDSVKGAGEIQQTAWDSRFLVAEPARGLKVLFWQKNRPAHGAIEGDLNARGMRFGVVVSRWNSFITERLLQGALDALRRSGARSEDITVVRVPGAFEIPAQARTLAQSGKYDAIVTLGCLIRGETTHYEHISTEVTRGIGQSAQETGVPHTYGVLTCENLEQALDRAGLKAGNKGFEAGISAIEMVSLQRKTRGRAKKKAASGKKSKGR
ncbi:MAG TPA: 6,7-dimethyl-8-ribityllumazine synthase [Candidatus Angelobacter sp.]|jgi:6,7-dimethyl-8-ribityllumazine synthase|nr:6,7-dimethyl-8-ribityllumazine synthase [Candidatus Angelobacter sp.]